GCNNDAPGLNGASRMVVPVIKTRQYLIVVEGVNGARGTAWLNYILDTNTPPTAPTLLSPPTARVAEPGSCVTLAADWTASPPLQFWWQKNQTLLPGIKSPALLLANVTMTDSADYALSVSNDLGALTVTLPLRVVIPPQCNLSLSSAGLQLTWP